MATDYFKAGPYGAACNNIDYPDDRGSELIIENLHSTCAIIATTQQGSTDAQGKVTKLDPETRTYAPKEVRSLGVCSEHPETGSKSWVNVLDAQWADPNCPVQHLQALAKEKKH